MEPERSPQHFDKVDSAASLSLWLWRSRPGRRPFARRNYAEAALLLDPTFPVRINEDHLGVQLAVVDWLAASVLQLDTPRQSILGPLKPHRDKPRLLAPAVRDLIREQNEASEQRAHRADCTYPDRGIRHATSFEAAPPYPVLPIDRRHDDDSRRTTEATMTLLRVCRCGNLIAATRRRCPTCQRAESTRRRNKPSGKVYADPRWRVTRRVVLERDDHTCTVCGGAATHVDHRPPITTLLARGESPFDPAYCRACCASCAGRADAARAHPGGRGRIEKPFRPAIPRQLAARKTPSSLHRAEDDRPPLIA